MVRHGQILFLDPLERLDQPFKGPPTPLLHLLFLALLHREQEVRIVFERRLERVAVLADEVEVDACSPARHLLVFHGGRVHVDEPPDLLLAGVEAREAHGLVDAVGQACGLEPLIL
jgi:hypothetical protein